MVRKKDPFWEYAEVVNNRFQCNFCKNVYSGGIVRLKYHLSGLKGHGIEICTKVSNDVQAKAYIAMEKSSKKCRSEAHSTTSMVSRGDSCGGFDIHGMPSPSPSFMGKRMHQSIIPQMTKMDQNELDNMVANFFILNNIPLNVVQSQSFIELVKSACEFGPTYTLPNSSVLRKKGILELKKEVDEYVDKVKKSWKTTGCTIIADTWTDMKQHCFINLIAQSYGGSVFLKSIEISKDRKTNSVLADLVYEIIEKVGPQHVVQFMVDDALNLEFVGDLLIGKYPTMYKNRCASHEMQLFFKDVYNGIDWVRTSVDDCKFIQSYMYRHKVITTLMRETTNGKALRKSCATSFASNFLVIQSILDVENELRRFVASPQWRGLDYSMTSEGLRVTKIIQNNEFWSQARDVIEVLKPFGRVLHLVDGKGFTSGYIYQAMNIAKQSLEIKCTQDNEKYGHIKKLLSKRLNDNTINLIYAAAAFLNPAYMCGDSFVETHEMKQGINYICENMVPVEDQKSFLEQILLYRKSHAPLFTSTAKAMLKTAHPGLWWDYCGDELPVLQKYAARIWSQPCSFSSRKRSWSAFETAQMRKSNQFSPPMPAGDSIYMRMNFLMMKNFQEKYIKCYMKPIDIDNLKDWPDFEDEILPTTDEDVIMEDVSGSGIIDMDSVCLTFVDSDDDDDDDDRSGDDNIGDDNIGTS